MDKSKAPRTAQKAGEGAVRLDPRGGTVADSISYHHRKVQPFLPKCGEAEVVDQMQKRLFKVDCKMKFDT